MVIVIFVVSIILSAGIVNAIQRGFMKFIGADSMFYSMKTKVIIIIIVALFLTGLAMKLFGIK